MSEITSKPEGSDNRLPIDAGAIVGALRGGLIGTAASGLVLILFANIAVPLVVMGGAPILMAGIGTFIGYRLGLHDK